MEKIYVITSQYIYKDIKFVTTDLKLATQKMSELVEEEGQHFEDRINCEIWQNNQCIGYLDCEIAIIAKYKLKNIAEVII